MRRGLMVLGLLASVAAAPDGFAAPRYDWRESGTATFYRASHLFHRTSSGEIFNENAMTAAHPTLPLGTLVRVTRDDTGGSVVVRVNDRSASSNIRRGRVIDLSFGAARRLGIHGTGAVTLTEIDATDPAAPLEVAEAPDQPRRRHRR